MSVEALGAQCSKATWTLVGEPQETTQAEFEQFAQTFADSALENVRRMLG